MIDMNAFWRSFFAHLILTSIILLLILAVAGPFYVGSSLFAWTGSVFLSLFGGLATAGVLISLIVGLCVGGEKGGQIWLFEPVTGPYPIPRPHIHQWAGPGPEPAKWVAPDNTIVYRSYRDYCDD